MFDQHGEMSSSASAAFHFDRCTHDGDKAVFRLDQGDEARIPDMLSRIRARGNLKNGFDSGGVRGGFCRWMLLPFVEAWVMWYWTISLF